MSALAGLVLVLVMPAMAGAVLLSGPDRPAAGEPDDTPDRALSRGLACGVATWFLGSGLLTRTVGLTATSAWVWDALVATVSLVVLLLPRNRPRLRTVLGPVGRRVAEIGGLTALVFLPPVTPSSLRGRRSGHTVVLLRARPAGRGRRLHPGDIARVRYDDALPQRLPPVHHRRRCSCSIPAAMAVITTALIGVLRSASARDSHVGLGAAG
jgi:hypothetical protein